MIRSVVLFSFAGLAAAAAAPQGVRFEKLRLTEEYNCDGINAGDIDRDGKPDVVAGPYWFRGPDFKERHEYYRPHPLPMDTTPTDNMSTWVYDFNGDGWNDILVVGRVLHHEAFWYENPQGKSGLWTKHFVFHRVLGETPAFVDLTGDGKPEMIAHWEGRWGYLAPDWQKPNEPWQFHPVTEKGDFMEYYHGEGVGDVNGDGRMDLLLNEGWWEQPAHAGNGAWIAHPYVFSADRGGAHMYAYDVDGDGDNDVITALNAHGWGLAWFEHVSDGKGGITFKKHQLMGTREEEQKYGVAFSQPHAVCLADVNGDGLQDIVVGKRMWAHGSKGDVEPMAAPVNYWFELKRDGANGVTYVPHLIDDHSGLGTQVVATDVNGDGTPDVLTSSKLGAFIFFNHRQ